MKKILILLLLLTASAGAQVTPPFAFWKTSGAAPSFSPTDIDSLKGWYVAADLADSLAKSDGDTTYIWPNRAKWHFSAAWTDLYQLTDSRKPVYRDSAYGKVLQFDGVDDNIRTTSAPAAAQPNTRIMVYKKYRPLGTGTLFSSDNSGGRHDYLGYNSGIARMYAGNTVNVGTGTTLSIDSVYCAVARFNTTSSSFRSNLLKFVTLDPGTANANGLNIAAFPGDLFFEKIGVLEYIEYDGLLTESEVEQVYTYLQSKYALP